MRVFSITCSSSLFAYIWLWIVLLDEMVEIWEGVLTLLFFFILITVAFGADRWTAKVNENKDSGKEENVFIEYSAYEIYKDLLVERQGNAPQDEKSVEKRTKMK